MRKRTYKENKEYRVGDIVIASTNTRRGSVSTRKRKKKAKILKLYPHIVLCDIGQKYKECFKYCDIVRAK